MLIHEFLLRLVEAEEPEVMLACLKRICERKAFKEVRREDRGEALRWQHMADAVTEVQLALERRGNLKVS